MDATIYGLAIEYISSPPLLIEVITVRALACPVPEAAVAVILVGFVDGQRSACVGN